MNPLFGPAGNSESFYAAGNKSTVQAMKWLHDRGLSAFEYQCGNGVRLTAQTAEKIRLEAEKYEIAVSLHAPYYISLTNSDEKIVQGNLRYITESAKAVKLLGGNRMVVHAGACGKQSRAEAMQTASANIRLALKALDDSGYSDITVCLETMGKLNQLGSAEEVAELCTLSGRLLPAIDFGHVNARTQGSLQREEDFFALLELFKKAIGFDRMQRFHCHFSKIEYTAGGEKRHLTFVDKQYGPPFEPLAKCLKREGYAPVMICESSGTQAEDSAAMKKMYYGIAEK